MLTSILLSFCFFGYIIFLYDRFKWPAAFLPFVTVSTIITILYFFSLFSELYIGTKIVFFLGLLLFVIFFIKQSFCFREFASEMFSPGMIIFLCAPALLWLGLHKLYFTGWDEYSSWGLLLKAIFSANNLPSGYFAQHYLIAADYTPAGELFQYFVLQVFGGFYEGVAYLAQDILLVAALISFFHKIHWRNYFLIPMITISAILMISAAQPSIGVFMTIYADVILAVFFGMSFVCFYSSYDDSGAIIRLIPILFALTLVKAAGVIFAIMLGLAVLNMQFFDLYNVIQKNNKKSLKFKMLAGFKKIGLVLILFISIGVAYESWQYHIKVNQIPPTLQLEHSWSEVKNGLSNNNAQQVKQETIHSFEQALLVHPLLFFPGGHFSERLITFIKLPYHLQNPVVNFYKKFLVVTKYTFKITVIGWGIIFITLSFLAVLFCYSKQKRLKMALLSIYMLLACLIYGLGLLYLYLFVYGGYEGPHLASFDRYMGICITGWMFLTFSMQLDNVISYPRSYINKILLIILPFFCFFSSDCNMRLYNQKDSLLIRNQISSQINSFQPIISPNKKVYVVFQNTNGFQYQVTRYFLFPVMAKNKGCWSLGKTYSNQDVWTCQETPKEFADHLKESDYLYLGQVDKQFWQEYQVLFENVREKGNFILFEIKPAQNQFGIQLVPVK